MNYTLHQLEVFLKVCETGSITKAAELLFLTQPAVSIQLKKFQEQFDLPLTENIGRNIYITDFGKELSEVVKKIIAEAENIHHIESLYKGFLVGKISFSIVSTGKYIVPYFLTDFINRYPAIKITVDVTNKSRVLESLEKNETDFSLVSVLPDGIEVEKVELMLNKLYLVGSDLPNIKNAEQLSELSMIYREQGSATRNAMEGFLKNNQLKPKNTLELASNEAVKQAVCAGLGYSIMPLIGMQDELASGKLQIVSVKGLPIISSWNLIYSKRKRLSPAAQAFLSYLEENKAKIIEKAFSKVNID